MSAKDKQKLRVSFSSSEMELLGRAARLAGKDDLSNWAKGVLLEVAQNLAEKRRETITPGDNQPPSSRPKCTCGATSSPTGQCDGSCIMRF